MNSFIACWTPFLCSHCIYIFSENSANRKIRKLIHLRKCTVQTNLNRNKKLHQRENILHLHKAKGYALRKILHWQNNYKMQILWRFASRIKNSKEIFVLLDITRIHFRLLILEILWWLYPNIKTNNKSCIEIFWVHI